MRHRWEISLVLHHRCLLWRSRHWKVDPKIRILNICKWSICQVLYSAQVTSGAVILILKSVAPVREKRLPHLQRWVTYKNSNSWPFCNEKRDVKESSCPKSSKMLVIMRFYQLRNLRIFLIIVNQSSRFQWLIKPTGFMEWNPTWRVTSFRFQRSVDF